MNQFQSEKLINFITFCCFLRVECNGPDVIVEK